MTKPSPKPVFFESAAAFRSWLEKNHQSEKEIVAGYYRVDTGKSTMTWSDSVDEALCFGWIDGIRKSVDEESYCIRFTPRNPKSNWSAINVKKMEELVKQGKMTQAGLAAFDKRLENQTAIYSYENRQEKLSPELESKFAAHQDAFDFFCSQAPSYQKAVIYWVMSAKQEQTRETRLTRLIDASGRQKRLS